MTPLCCIKFTVCIASRMFQAFVWLSNVGKVAIVSKSITIAGVGQEQIPKAYKLPHTTSVATTVCAFSSMLLSLCHALCHQLHVEQTIK